MMIVQMLGRRMESRISTTGRNGRTRKMSVSRIKRVSTIPPL